QDGMNGVRSRRVVAVVFVVGLSACTGQGSPAPDGERPGHASPSASLGGTPTASPAPLGPGPFGAPAAKGLGGMITFTSQTPNDLRISVMRADGTHQRLVVNTKELDFYPQWSPDGRRI